ncbi:MAG: serine/threonine-protein kinase [Planctomycetota bacterium]
MKTESSDPCDQQSIEQFLSGYLAIEDEAVLVRHIERCPDCRERMDRQAAGNETWDSARAFLVDDDDDPIRLSGLIELEVDAETGGQELISASAQVTNVLETLSPTDDPQMLGRLGPYEVSGVIGAGGMGVVLKGQDRSLDRVVAIKILAPHLATSGAARKRFAREAKAAAAVLHPNVMPIHGVMNGGPLPYLVMPYMRGASLQKRIDDQGTLSLIEILRVGSQVAGGLAAAHTLGLVHRDIKPANIMLADGLEQVAITDFGLARAVDDATMTRSGVIAGTPQYMSPEQARGEAIDARSDLFSLGSLIYAMCTGHSPFRAETSFGVLRRITEESPRMIRECNPEIPDWLGTLVRRLHRKDPDERVQTAREVEQLLNQCLAHVEQPESCPLPESLRSHDRLSAFKVSSVSLLVVTGLLLVFAVSWPSLVGNWNNEPRAEDGGQSDVASSHTHPAPAEDATDVEPLPEPATGSEVPGALDETIETITFELESDLALLETLLPEIDSLETELSLEFPYADEETRQSTTLGEDQ